MFELLLVEICEEKICKMMMVEHSFNSRPTITNTHARNGLNIEFRETCVICEVESSRFKMLQNDKMQNGSAKSVKKNTKLTMHKSFLQQLKCIK